MSHASISYGKLRVPVQLVRGPDLLAADVSVEVLGQSFLPAYTEGDNSSVVATDTMKNVILRHALEHDEAFTLEAFLDGLGHRFLRTYPEMEGLRLTADEQPFAARSDKLFALTGTDHATAEIELRRQPGGTVDHVCVRAGQTGLRLLKTTGSAFTRFARDDATTLPERRDRPLFIHLDVGWTYDEPTDAFSPDTHVDPQAVRELVLTTFDDFVSESIQHLVHEMGTRILAAFAPLQRVGFTAENHTFDPVPGSDPGASRRAYTAAFPAYGLITLELTR
jgi:urate oxidase